MASFTPADETTSTPSSLSLHLDPENGVSIDFNACQGAGRNNDLEAYYRRLSNEGRASTEELAKVQQTLVGNNNCQQKIDDFVVTQGFEKIQ